MVKKSMTEAEAIEVIRKAMEFSISAIAEIDKSKEKIDMVGLAGEYYENKENCEREIAACMLAINALKEIQEYRAIGTVEECRKAQESQKSVKCVTGRRGIGENVKLDREKEFMKTINEAIGWIKARKGMSVVIDDFVVDTAIKALTEYKQYKEIGTVEELKRLCYLRKRYEDETYDYCGEYGTSECGVKTQLERLKVYEEIGAVEEIKKSGEVFEFLLRQRGCQRLTYFGRV